ncbi:DnaD domain protein [Marinilactibacillus psychrotolerans]|uniref:DnaD domain protein n=1 Tax=Marinilactibacillus psychrotolerans TaxID=191770 RepID=A0A5R9C6Q5_9LACT|nr:phage replisome organizer N-terminal domain-containing protein [Marinilactibacillus psychrotolerans]TLQ08813.1 DnaD domain protein [Marinilactibacillus psychrotolerans]
MSENKKYYWLKLHDNFFDDDTIQYIEEQENGKEYVLFYLKLALKSLSREGYLIRYVGERVIPYDVKALAKLTNTPSDTVKAAMVMFIDFGLVQHLNSGELYLNQINEMIGAETQAAKRKREQRARDKQKELGTPTNEVEERDIVTEKRDSVQKSHGDVQKSHTEIDIETDIDKELEKETDKEKEESVSQSSFTFTWQDFFKANGFGILSPYIQESFFMWLDDFKKIGSTEKDFDLIVIEALKVGVTKNSKTWNFIEGVLRNWANQGLSTIESVEANEVAREAKRKQTSGFYGNKPIKTETMPAWANEENKGEEIDEEKQKEFAERLAKIRSRKKQV